MSITIAFSEYIELLKINDISPYESKFNRISNKLHEKYWSKSDDCKGIIVGSVGRGTAINGVSDLDMLYVLPDSVKKRIDKRSGNGQSALLQEVKNQISLSYPTTTKEGNGQVVVVSFRDYEFEVCPVFIKDNDTFYYPDSNNGGKWRTTKPNLEQAECVKIENEFGTVFKNLCFLTRAWKNSWGLKVGGLLIDTLVYDFLNSNTDLKNSVYSDYPQILLKYFEYLSGLKSEQSFWYALGSRQKVYNKNNGRFIKKAKKVKKKLEKTNLNSDEVYTAMRYIFGNKFPSYSSEKFTAKKYVSEMFSFTNTEQFIEDRYPVDIRYSLNLDCKVTQSGWQPFWLKESTKPLRTVKNLEFRAVFHDVPPPYRMYWKVRNRGVEAKKRDMIRGGLLADNGKEVRTEKSTFSGEHFVECYIVKNGVCVARDRINVPISIL